MRKADILIIEDDLHIRRFLRISLEANGFNVAESRLGEDGLCRCAESEPNLVILDLGLPDIDGREVLRRLREWSPVPVIVLSVRADDAEKVAALDAGANDYVTKPFSVSELMARVRVLLRKAPKSQIEQPKQHCGELELDLVKRRITLHDEELRVSRKEYDLLRLLIVNRGHVLTHQEILREIWGPAHDSDIHYLRVLVGHLRQKLRDEPSEPRYIHTIQGVGYRFSDE